MNKSPRLLASLVVALSASFVGVGCAPGTDVTGEQVDKQHAAFTSSGTTVGEWSALPDGVECLEGMQGFYPAKFGVSLPIAPDSAYGDCTNVGACHLWLDAQPDPGTWERIDAGTPSTYDLIVYPPIGKDPWGHIAAVDHVENGQIFVMDDNYVGHHVRSSTPHTVDWAAYGWYHLRSLPKDSGSSGGGSSGGGCAGLGNGLYCGGDNVQGDAGTLYQCSGGNLSVAQVCDSGCQVMPNGTDDQCASGGGGGGGGSTSCAGASDGLYCGGDNVPGDAGTLYQCTSGTLSVYQACANGCQVMPNGTNDQCN